ncbi:MAG: DUF4468 domain-containing protein [Bacteroidaceae bacterium]|nr:DUF4468 domain-containing protein [Bacteroidaceae bacterium]
MRKILLLILLAIVSINATQAQLFKKKDKTAKQEYAVGTVPVVNNKVAFEQVIPAEGLSAAEVESVVREWFSARFVKPTVIGFKEYEPEVPGTLVAKSEEYIVFRNTFFVLNRARIYYFLTITPTDGSCKLNMSRITYWWDDEADDGGLKINAEECITDDVAINKKGELHRFYGKFRTKTIDLFNMLAGELTGLLNTNK